MSLHNGKLYIETVGCQMNMLDSEMVVAALRKQGYDLTDKPDDADTILFNTCSVREHAEHKIYSALGRLKFSKKKRPQQVIGVLGCMAQKDQQLVFKKAPHVDLVVGTGQLAEVPRLIDEARTRREQSLAVSLDRKGGSRAEVAASFQSFDALREPTMRPSPFQAFVRIMIGCDKFCTYCVVPMTRGPEQSRTPAEILFETRVLADQGVREITLLGQTVNSYKVTQDGKTYRLADLLEMLHDINGIERLKFVTNYPRDMTDDLLHAVRDLRKCSRYLHVPLQSGCDEMLKRMKRGYTVDQYREMHGRIKAILPDSAVSSDFIVGFSGETEESHQKSLDLIRECRFKNSFIFKYSPRPGTKAYGLLPDDVPEDVKRRRNQELLALQNEISEEDNAAFVGRAVQILVEGPSKTALKSEFVLEGWTPPTTGDGHHHEMLAESADHGHHDGHHHECGASQDTAGLNIVPLQVSVAPLAPATTQLVGRTTCDRIVVFDGNPRLVGSLVDVAIEDCSPTTLMGSIITRTRQHGSNSLLPILS